MCYLMLIQVILFGFAYYIVNTTLHCLQKRYVQHILREIADTVYKQIVQERGHFYVCGDVSMAEDVNQTLRQIIQDQGNMGTLAVDNVIKRLQEENRYHEDIFGITLKTAEVTNRGRAEAKSRRSTSSS